MDIWRPGEVSQTIGAKKIMVVGESKFPYLDIEMSHGENQDLKFDVHTKPGSKIRYLNIGSSHTMVCRKAVPRGISIRLAGLTSREVDNENKSLSDPYPKTHTVLEKAGYLRNSKLTKLGDILDKSDMDMVESSI